MIQRYFVYNTVSVLCNLFLYIYYLFPVIISNKWFFNVFFNEQFVFPGMTISVSVYFVGSVFSEFFNGEIHYADLFILSTFKNEHIS